MKQKLKNNINLFCKYNNLNYKQFQNLVYIFGKHFFQYSLFVEQKTETDIQEILENILSYQNWTHHYFNKLLDNKIGKILLSNTLSYSFLIPGLISLIKKTYNKKEVAEISDLISYLEK